MFHLCKWYCDLTTNDGTVLIGYWSQLRWGLLRLSHASYIFFRSDGSLRQRGTLFAGAGPQLCENEMNWSCQPLQLIGSWRARAQSVKQVLLEGHEGSVKWDCHMPTADVQIEFEGEILRGVGYVEQLTMTLPPWRLPFAELRWGRAMVEGHHVVWIDWSGGVERRWSFIDSQPVTMSYCSDEQLVFANGWNLLLEQKRTLRAGTIGEVLTCIPGLNLFVPKRVRHASETKWLSRATWHDGKQGLAIHEVVRWA